MDFKFKHLAAAFAVAMLFSSCHSDEEIISNEPYYQTISAEFVEPEEALQTRSCVDVKNPSTDFVGLLWQVADKLGVFSANGSENAEFTNKATETAPKVEFGGELANEAKYAYFPFSKSSGTNVKSLSGNVLAEQPFNPEDGTLVCDYKVGVREEGTNTFTFQQILTMLRVTIDASETELEGERLNEIVLTVTDKNGNARNISGDFTFDATSGGVTVGTARANSNKITMPWTTRPTLTKGKTYQGFISVMPDVIKKDDVLTIEVTSDAHRATFTLDCVTDLIKGYIYNIPLKLKELIDKYKDEGKAEVEELSIPTINSFSFEVGKNNNKLLDTKLTWSTSSRNVTTSGVTSHTATIDNENNEVKMIIPYLYDFKLIPTFTAGGTVTVNGEKIESGKTVVDFTNPVVFTVTADKGGSRDYTVKITNTGLPVVVIEQAAHSYAEETKKIGSALGKHTISINKLADIVIRPKDSDWAEDDKITVYNPDGTVDCTTTNCGVRLRGNTTQEYPKKPFAVKLTEEKSVLGMPAHKRWVLLANWLDHSMIRNTVAFDIAHAVEYAWRLSDGKIDAGVPWNVHGQNVELVLKSADGKAHHVGNYFLCEQIKIDKNRLNISSEKGADTGTDYTQYGYLLELDTNLDEDCVFETSEKKVPFMFKDNVSSTISNKIQEKINRIESNICKGTDPGFDAAFNELDINSVIDQWLVLELAMNREYADPRSVYMFMDGDGKLSGGPVWDFDRGTFQNPSKAKDLCSYVLGGSSNTTYRVKNYKEFLCWRTQENETYSYVWYKQLIKSAAFQAKVKERWAEIKPYLDMIPSQIQYYGETLAESYKYDSAMWPTNKEDIRYYKWDFNDWSGDETLGANGNYQAVIDNFVTVYQERLNGMDQLITSGKFTK